MAKTPLFDDENQSGSEGSVHDLAAKTASDTESTLPDILSPQEESVLAALLEGDSKTAAARLAGVSRSTVHRLVTQPRFVAEFNTGKLELRHRNRVAMNPSSALPWGD